MTGKDLSSQADGAGIAGRNEESEMDNGNKNDNATYLIRPAAPAAKKLVTVEIAGANRGARMNLPHLAALNRTSQSLAVSARIADPVPGRAAALGAEAERQGMEASAFEGRIQDIISANGEQIAPGLKVIVFHTDRASTIRDTLSAPGAEAFHALIYLLIKLPSGRLWGLRAVLPAGDIERCHKAVAFCGGLAEYSERNTSADVIGEGADPAHRLAEPVIRKWFADHTEANLNKLAAGVEPATPPFEVTPNGTDTYQLFIVRKPAWSEPGELADEVLADPPSPIRRGSQFVIAEITDEGLRFHPVRRRRDDRISVGGVEVIDQATAEAMRRDEAARAEAGRRAEEARRAMAEAIERSARETISRRNPVATTD